MTGGARPPRWAAWLLERCAPPSARDHVLGDLEEEFGIKAERWGRSRATLWYVSQTVRSIPLLLRERLSKGGLGQTPLDLRYAMRSLRHNPTLTVVAVASLALGIGANTVVFSLVHALLLEPLPLAEPDRLVVVQSLHAPAQQSPWLSVPDYESVREGSSALASLAAFTPDAFILQTGSDALYVGGAEVSTDYFDVLGVDPLVGRLFGDQDREADRVVIAEGLWSRVFGADVAVVGDVIELDGRPVEIVGVVGDEADILGDGELWVPIRTSIAEWRQRRGTDWIHAVGRLAPEADLPGLDGDLDRIGTGLAEAFPDSNTDQSFASVSLSEWMTGSSRLALLIAMAGAGLILLIACANLAGLLLARALERRREIATRIALGVDRARLFRQLIAESALMAVTGGGIGVAVAAIGVRAAPGLLSTSAPRLDAFGMKGSVLAFSAALTLGSLVLFGLAPAWRAAAQHPSEVLTQRGRSAGRGQVRTRRVLVVGQIALALVLLIGATVLLRSFARLQSVELGLRAEGVVTARLPLVDADFPNNVERTRHYRQLLDAVSRVPGLEAAAMVSAIPLRDPGPSYSFETNEPTPIAEEDRIAGFTAVLGDYFGVMGIDLMAGRLFDDDELSGVVPAVVVDQAFERTFFPDGAVGREIDVVDATATIVGVVESVPDLTPARPGRPRMYVPLTPELRQTMAVVARSPLDGDQALAVLRSAVRNAAPDQTVQAPLPMVEYWRRSLRLERTMLGLIGAMSMIALLLAALGTYGVLAYLVSRRTREIGVRVAMGAAPGSVRVMILRSAAALLGAGLAAGVVLSMLGLRYLDTLLFETAALDPVAFAASVIVLFGVGLAAALRPAMRATRTPPLEALNSE